MDLLDPQNPVGAVTRPALSGPSGNSHSCHPTSIFHITCRCLLWAALTRNTEERELWGPRSAPPGCKATTLQPMALGMEPPSCRPSSETSSLSSSLVATRTRTQAARSLPSMLMFSGGNEVIRGGFSRATSLPVSDSLEGIDSLLGFTEHEHLPPLEGGERIAPHYAP